MDKQIPIYFNASPISSSPLNIQELSDSKIYEAKVRVFTKGKNRNGSYITDAVAEKLITSCLEKTIPVIGFFDNETKTWAGHTGPSLAKGYGYCKDFLGWEPYTDTDGITREYAIFSVVLFADYFEETQYILGANQSMELNRNSIEGDWADFDGEEYFVYTNASMLGFCIIGEHEPCFSVSAFFSKQDDNYDVFAALLSELKEKINKGGEQKMEIVEETIVEQVEETFSTTTEENVVEEFEETQIAAVEEEEVVEPVNYEQMYNDLMNQYNQLAADFDALKAQSEADKNEYELNIQSLNDSITEMKNTITNYEALESARLEEAKGNLISSYKNLLGEEEITTISAEAHNFNYDELKAKLAVCYADKALAEKQTVNFGLKVPMVEHNDNSFAILMQKYKKN